MILRRFIFQIHRFDSVNLSAQKTDCFFCNLNFFFCLFALVRHKSPPYFNKGQAPFHQNIHGSNRSRYA